MAIIETYKGPSLSLDRKRAIIIHQWMAGVDGDWRPWLKSELQKRGYEVLVPEMPDIDTPVIEKWVNKIAEVVGKPDTNTYFVGHSIGCQTILRYLETIKTPVGGAVFVAGWFNLKNLESPEVEEIAKPWIETPIDLEKVRTILPKSTLIISDNDPFGCFEENTAKFTELGSKIVVMHNAGHISAEEGFTELPGILNEI
jgi:predicted alpha/beta hydrolase family esterase